MAIKTRNSLNASFSMSSMTDIVFLLLIFFMLTSTLVTTNGIDVLTPSTNRTKPPTKAPVKIAVDRNLNYYIDNSLVKKELLEASLTQKMASAENKVVVLSVEKTVPIENAVYVMDIANQNHIKVVLAARPPR